MNPRQKRVVKLVAEGKSQTAAYKEVYGVTSDDVAKKSASRLLTNDNVKNALQEALRAQGIDEVSIGQTLIEMKNNRDWRAKESFVDRSSKFLGYDQGPQSLTQVNIGGDLGISFTTDNET